MHRLQRQGRDLRRVQPAATCFAETNATATAIRIENTDTTIVTAQEVNTIEFYSNDASTSGTGVSAKIAQVAENNGNQYSLAFSTYNTSLAEAMRIDESGNVGINTTTPGGKLSVRGSSGLGISDSHLAFGSNQDAYSLLAQPASWCLEA